MKSMKRLISAVVLVALLCLVLGLQFINLNTVQAQSLPPQSGDWIIENATALHDGEYTLKGDLVIKRSSSLELLNVTLWFDPEEDGGNGILVEEGAYLALYSGCKIGISQSTKRMTFVVRGDAYISDSTVEGLYGNGEKGGLVVEEGNLEMTRTTLSGSSGTGIYLEHAQSTLLYSAIENNDGSGIIIVGGTPLLSGCNITSNGGDGISITGGASVDVLDCVIEYSGGNGISIDGSSGLIRNNSITSNGNNGVTCNDVLEGLTLEENFIKSNSGWGIYSTGGEPDLVSNGIAGEGENLLGRIFLARHLSVKVSSKDGSPKVGAMVIVESQTDYQAGNLLTNETGSVYFNTVVVRRLMNDGQDIVDDEYSVTVTLSDQDGGVSQTKTVTMDQNRFLSFSMDPADLVISDLQISDREVNEGDKVDISAVLSNTGGSEARDITLTFYDGSKVIKETTIASLKPGASEEVSAKWDTSDESTGKHKIKVIVDPEDDIKEMNETNNDVSGHVEVNLNPIFKYAIPILIALAVLGIGGYNLYYWVVIKRIQSKQRKDEKPKEDDKGSYKLGPKDKTRNKERDSKNKRKETKKKKSSKKKQLKNG
jgi:hypothetical protein